MIIQSPWLVRPLLALPLVLLAACGGGGGGNGDSIPGTPHEIGVPPAPPQPDPGPCLTTSDLTTEDGGCLATTLTDLNSGIPITDHPVDPPVDSQDVQDSQPDAKKPDVDPPQPNPDPDPGEGTPDPDPGEDPPQPNPDPPVDPPVDPPQPNPDSCLTTHDGSCLTDAQVAAKVQQLTAAIKAKVVARIDSDFPEGWSYFTDHIWARKALKYPLEMVNRYEALANLELMLGPDAASKPGKGVTIGFIGSGIHSAHDAFQYKGSGRTITQEFLEGATQSNHHYHSLPLRHHRPPAAPAATPRGGAQTMGFG